MNPITAAKWGGVALVLGLVFLGGRSCGAQGKADDLRDLQVAYAEHLKDDEVERFEMLAQVLEAEQGAREAEQRHAQELADVARLHQEDRRNAERTQERVVADVRADNLRLREHWRGCETARLSEAATGAGGADAGADLRATGAGDLVRIGADADAQVRGLQRALNACVALHRP